MRPAAATEGRRAGRSCRPSLCPAAWPDVPRISGSGPIDLPRAEGAAAALNSRRAQPPALDLSRIRSRLGPCRSRCSTSRAPRRPAAAPGGRRAGRSCRPSLYSAAWPDVSRISGSGPIDLPRAEGAAAALNPGRAQLPTLDLSRIRSRPGPCRSACTASRAPRRPPVL